MYPFAQPPQPQPTMEQLMQQMLLLQQQQQQTNNMLMQMMTMIQTQGRMPLPAGGQIQMPQVTTDLGLAF